MARKSDTSTPQQALQKAVDARYPSMGRFFKAVAEEANVTPASAKGTFYAFMRASSTGRGLPADQRAAYLKLVKVRESTLDAIDALRPKSGASLHRRDRQAELEAGLLALTKRVRLLTGRVADLEAQAQPKKRRGGSSG